MNVRCTLCRLVMRILASLTAGSGRRQIRSGRQAFRTRDVCKWARPWLSSRPHRCVNALSFTHSGTDRTPSWSAGHCPNIVDVLTAKETYHEPQVLAYALQMSVDISRTVCMCTATARSGLVS